MGKVKDKKGIPHEDVYQRMNFLHQASMLLAVSGDELAGVSRGLGRDLADIPKRLNLRRDPRVKRDHCKRCSTPLIPGETLDCRVKDKGGKAMVRRCLACGHTRRLLLDPKHVPFNWVASQDESVSSSKGADGVNGQ